MPPRVRGRAVATHRFSVSRQAVHFAYGGLLVLLFVSLGGTGFGIGGAEAFILQLRDEALQREGRVVEVGLGALVCLFSPIDIESVHREGGVRPTEALVFELFDEASAREGGVVEVVLGRA